MRPALFLIALTACTPFPELDEAISEDAREAPYPQLAPLPDILAQEPGTSDDTDMAARIAALNARAAALRQIEIGALQ